MNLNTIFWGSSDLSIPFLDLLREKKEIQLKKVITQPAKPKGRGLKFSSTVVEIFSKRFGIEVLSPQDINSSEFLKEIKEINPDISLIVSYGKILPKVILDLHKIGVLNVHFSFLPKYRGAAPIQWSLINGEKHSGVTVFWVNEKLDEGKIFLQERINIEYEDNYLTLSKKLVKVGIYLCGICINRILNNQIIKEEQIGQASYAPVIKKDLAIIDWKKDNMQIHNLVRGIVLWPKATTKLKTKEKFISLKILKTSIINQRCELFYKEGSIIKIEKDGIIVKCANNTLIKILTVQPENKKEMTVKEFLCGYKVSVGDIFG